MPRQRKLFIITRSFWPESQIIGEGLLQLAEKQSEKINVGVVFQHTGHALNHLKQKNRGDGVNFYPCKSRAVSGSSILQRILDALIFMSWTMLMLIKHRPTLIYVSTNPPVAVPFAVMIYCKIFNAKYIYHLQDIHPEITNLVMPMNRLVYGLLQWIDSLTMKKANLLLTINNEMASEIKKRANTQAPIKTLPNPSASFEEVKAEKISLGFSFCGNAGRLQRIPLLLDAITQYCKQGGKLPFVFAGAGVYASDLTKLAEQFSNIKYKGLVTAHEAAIITASYRWALLSIDDEVLRYAFPSKSSTYALSGANIVAICGQQTSVASWVRSKCLGIVVEPSTKELVNFFFQVEKNLISNQRLNNKESLSEDLSINKNVERLNDFVESI